MKKIVTLVVLLASLNSYGQVLDTIYVRNLTLQAQDWAWLTGSDSVTLKAFRKLRTVVQNPVPAQWTTNVTVDSLPGYVVINFYQMVKTANAGEIASRYTAITNAIAAKVVLAYWLGLVDGAVSSDFDRNRNLGKYRLLDQ
jgi:hypothetical protein